jgi:hypothetical protein
VGLLHCGLDQFVDAGSTQSNPYCKGTEVTKYEDRARVVTETAARIKKCESVLVIGGGNVRS